MKFSLAPLSPLLGLSVRVREIDVALLLLLLDFIFLSMHVKFYCNCYARIFAATRVFIFNKFKSLYMRVLCALIMRHTSGGGGFNFFVIHNEPKMTLEDAQPKGVKCVEFI